MNWLKKIFGKNNNEHTCTHGGSCGHSHDMNDKEIADKTECERNIDTIKQMLRDAGHEDVADNQ
jgi:hypothetical protein